MNSTLLRFLTSACLSATAFAADTPAKDECAQPSPEEMAKAVGVKLPRLPWHVVNVWWDFEKPVEHFESLSMEVTIDRDVPATYNLYVSPCGIAEINPIFVRDEKLRRQPLEIKKPE